MDVEGVKSEYVRLFDEKATELHKLRSDYESQAEELDRTKKLLADQQYAAHEFQQQVSTYLKHERGKFYPLGMYVYPSGRSNTRGLVMRLNLKNRCCE